jgi:hypothetical protein
MAIAVMTSYGRSGSTLLNRCLGCLPDVLVLSELNPQGGGAGAPGTRQCQTVQKQAEHWYGIRLKNQDFVGGVLELHDWCTRAGRHLVLRDWTYVSFAPHPYNANQPLSRLVAIEALREHVEVRPFAFVRDAVDVWISFKFLSAADFITPYLRYVRAILDHGMPIFRYEAFCEEPEIELRRICKCAGLPFCQAYRNYQSFTTVNGDVQSASTSRGWQAGEIVRLPRKPVSPLRLEELHNCPEMAETNRLLGYPVDFSDIPVDAAEVPEPRRGGLFGWICR